jgi:hypothetical protein
MLHLNNQARKEHKRLISRSGRHYYQEKCTHYRLQACLLSDILAAHLPQPIAILVRYLHNQDSNPACVAVFFLHHYSQAGAVAHWPSYPILSFSLILSVSRGGVRLSHLVGRPLTGLLYQPRMVDDECVAVGGMRIGRGNQSTQRKPASVPLCPPQIPHTTWPRTRAAAVGRRQLTAWAMARHYPVRTGTFYFGRTAADFSQQPIRVQTMRGTSH